MGEFSVLWKALSQNMMWGVTKEDIRPQPLASRPHPCTCVYTEEHVQRHILHTQREAHLKSSHIEETSKYKPWDWYYKKKMGGRVPVALIQAMTFSTRSQSTGNKSKIYK